MKNKCGLFVGEKKEKKNATKNANETKHFKKSMFNLIEKKKTYFMNWIRRKSI